MFLGLLLRDSVLADIKIAGMCCEHHCIQSLCVRGWLALTLSLSLDGPAMDPVLMYSFKASYSPPQQTIQNTEGERDIHYNKMAENSSQRSGISSTGDFAEQADVLSSDYLFPHHPLVVRAANERTGEHDQGQVLESNMCSVPLLPQGRVSDGQGDGARA